MLASILIPSRRGPAALRRTLESITASAVGDSYEILLRVDADDAHTLSARDELSRMHSARFIIGQRGNGYADLHHYYTELANRAQGDWIMIFNDDAILEGPWDAQLAKVPKTGYIAFPEWERLGGSTYRYNAGGGFPVVPNRSWHKDEHTEIGAMVDRFLDAPLRERGWKPWFLPGVTFNHQRQIDAILPKERY